MVIDVKRVVKWVVITLLTIIIISLIANSFTKVPTGHVGIKTRFGAVQNEYISEGLNVKFPIGEKIELMDCRTQRVDVEGESASKDLQAITVNIAVNYHVESERAFELYKTVGRDYEEILIKPAIQEAMKTTIAQYNAEESITKRDEVALHLEETLEKKLANKGIKIDAINIVNFSFSNAFDDAIEKKQIAEQETKKAQQELEKVKIEAEKKVVQAEADAKSKIVQAEAEAEALRIQKANITDDLLKLRQIENEQKWIAKWNGQLPTTVLSDGSTIMYGINK